MVLLIVAVGSVCYVATWELVYYKLASSVRLWDSASQIRAPPAVNLDITDS